MNAEKNFLRVQKSISLFLLLKDTARPVPYGNYPSMAVTKTSRDRGMPRVPKVLDTEINKGRLVRHLERHAEVKTRG